MGEISDAINAIAAHGQKATGLVTGTIGTAAVTGCGGLLLTAGLVETVFGPEDVIPIMAGGALTCCCLLPAAAGGTAVLLHRRGHGRGWLARWQTLRQEVYGPQVIHQGRPVPDSDATDVQWQERPLHERDPLTYLMNDPLHILVIGHSGGGKTTLIHALATTWARQGQFVAVCDPQTALGMWPGCHVFGRKLNYQEIRASLHKVKAEFDRRVALRGEGQTQFRDIYVILEEYKMIAEALPEAREWIEGILRVGRKLGIHLVLGVQDKQVKTMGLEGASSLLENFTFMVMATLNRQENQRYWTIMENNDPSTRVTVLAPRLPDPERFIARRDGQTGEVLTLEQRLGVAPVADAVQAETAAAGSKPPLPHPPVATPSAPAGAATPTPNQPTPTGVAPPTPAQPIANGRAAEALDGDTLEERVAELLQDETPSPIEGLAVGQAMGIALCLLWGKSQNQTFDLVFGPNGKNPARHARLKEIVAALETHLGGAD